MGLETAAIIGISTAIASAGASAGQAVSAGQAARNAKKSSEDAFDKAMKELSANRIAGLSLPREAMERQIEANLSAGAQAIGQASEGDPRGVAATAGRVQMAQMEGQRDIAGDIGQQLMGLEAATAEEETRLAGARANLNLAEAQGAQAAEAQFGAQKDAAITGAFSSLQSAGQQYMEGSELYKKSEGVRELDRLNKEYDKAVSSGKISSRFIDPATKKAVPFNVAISKLSGYGEDLSKLSGMDQLKAADYLTERPQIIKSISGDVFTRGVDQGISAKLPQRNISTSINAFSPSFNANPFGF
jgi:hypothetical protein